MSDPLSILKGEIKRLGFVSNEKLSLLAHFTGNVEKIAVAVSCLDDCDNDEEKRNYLRFLISPPDQPSATEVRKKITDAFPGGLSYVKPEPLLYTSGSNWEYQPDPSLKQILREALKKHYKNFTLGRFDKLDLPIYLFLSGAGTGKSRNANEFHQTAITCLSAQEDEEMLTKIKEAWVFHISYENGFSLKQEESNPYLAIGTRMLFQLLREKMRLHEIIETYKPPDPLDVVSVIAKHYNRDLKSVTVILVVDGMQQLMENKDDGLKLNSTFYKTLTSFADLAFSGTFIIPVCTSTITGPIDGMLRYSTRDRVYLPVASLQPPNYQQGVPVFKNDKVTNTLVEDCGGHGRALEVLNDCLAGRSIEECNVDTLMNDLRYNLTKKYRDAIFGSVEEARPIARAILTRRLLNRYKPIPKTDKTPDEFVGGGLIRFEQVENSPKGYLTAPYIWLWIFVEMSQQLGDPILRDWEFADYGEQRALLNPVTSLQAKSWQSFEKFVASFRCIKSAVIEEDEPTSISEVHAGARLNGDIQFKNHNLQLEVAKHHTDTRSKTLTASGWNIVCYNSTVDVRKFKHCIINAPASPYGDFFLSLDQPDTESPNEIHQFKLRKKAVSKKEYQEEREKSASENDFFILFTTANCNIEIPKKSGIVDRNAFTNYFGPFAGRAYRSAMANPSIYNNKVKNIHTVSLGQICNVNQSKERVNAKTKIPMRNFYFRKGLHMISRILPRFM
ncbi:putative crinkler family protein [Gigaspora margarita]|uniref:Putative crinkler family protein n=1 Tax=Gigaspora margarita TaxID=4874 RepID=A0A8H3XK16_GIGMA|nr:putative crinkler family protein [Gigaspora margarita]